MPFLTLNGTTFQVRSNALQQKYNEHRLDRERMFDGTMRLTRGGVFRQWDVTLKYLTDAEATTAMALINSGAVLTAGGDVIGEPVGVLAVPGMNNPIQTGDGFRRQVTFTLHEQGGPLPPDRTAEPFLFWQRGRGYWQDIDNSKTTPALDGDLVFTWEDQSGHGRDGQAHSADFDSSDFRPVRDGNELHFGVGEFSPPSAGSGATLIRSDAIFGVDELHMMCGIRAALDPPTSGRENAFSFQPGGGVTSGTRYPDADGHVYINWGFTDGLDCGDPVSDLTSFHVLGMSGSNITNEIVVKLDNIIVATHTLVGAEIPGWGFAGGSGFPGALEAIGMAIGGDGWEGWFRDVFMTASVMTPAQERSWYDYIRGATDEPPLPI